jgi:hypothetical protein
MDEEREELLQKLRGANPVDEEQFDGWVAEEGGRFLDTRVFKRGGPSVDRHSWRRSVAIPLVATIVLALGIAAMVFTLTGGGPQTATSAGEQWAGSESPVEHVPRQEALERLVALTDSPQPSGTSPVSADPDNGADSQPSGSWGYSQMESAGTDNGADSQLVGRAVAAGILLPSEGPDFRLEEPVTRGEFALWVWRACGSRLAPTRAANFIDLGEQPEAEQDAIIGLAKAGLLTSNGDGLFHPDSPLTSQDESLILTRLGEVLLP